MARRRQHRRLNVFLNGRHVGELNRQVSGAIDFRYAPDWLAWRSALPVSLSLPLREDRYIGDPVLAVFDNLLPDNDAIRKRVAEQVGSGGADAFSLLAALGRDCVGALQFLPEGADPGSPGEVDGQPVSDAEIAAILRNLVRHPLGLEEDDDFRISIAGAQEKTALLRMDGRWLKPTGSTPTTHILKPQIGMLPNGIDLSNSVENEYFCLTLTRALGLPSATVEITDFEDKRVLVVERFDRLWARDGRLLRVPQEDCCQALSVPWAGKYEKDGGPGIKPIMGLLAGSDEPSTDRRNFFKAMIVFWLLGATDGHAKNFSLQLFPGGGYRLAPLYDVISAQPSVDAGQIRRNRMRLAMAVGTSRHYQIDDVVPRHFIQTAEAVGLGRQIVLDIIGDLIANAGSILDETIAGLPKGLIPDAVVQSIARGFQTRLQQLADARADGL